MMITKQSIELFLEWYKEELELSKVRIPSAVCLSTIGLDGFPNARFVSFKEVVDNSFVVTGPLRSRKGAEIENKPNVALTFWWTETERQVRIQGTTSKISDELADMYFNERSRNSQAVSAICQQGYEVGNLDELEMKIVEKVAESTPIQRPEYWSGFLIKPIRIEFMEFKKTRFHNRKLYEMENSEWRMKHIQP